MTLVPMSLVGSLRGVQAIPEPCDSNSNSILGTLASTTISLINLAWDDLLKPGAAEIRYSYRHSEWLSYKS
jgi:hypothetical protein